MDRSSGETGKKNKIIKKIQDTVSKETLFGYRKLLKNIINFHLKHLKIKLESNQISKDLLDLIENMKTLKIANFYDFFQMKDFYSQIDFSIESTTIFALGLNNVNLLLYNQLN